MEFNYSTDSEFEEVQPTRSFQWLNQSQFSSGFFHITEEDAIAYWLSRLKLTEKSELGTLEYEYPPSTGDSESDDVQSVDVMETDKVYYPIDENLRNICHGQNITFKHLPFRKLTYKKRSQIRNWPGYTLFEPNGLPTILMLPGAFSSLKCRELQEIDLAPPKRSTKPSDLTLFDLVQFKKQQRRRLRKTVKRHSDDSSDSTSSPDSGPSKKPRSSSSEADDESRSDSGIHGFSSTNSSATDQSGIGLDSLFCDEVFIDEP